MCSGSESRWQYRERAVHSILNNLQAIVKCLTIITTADEWVHDDASVSAARGLLGYLKDKQFLFLLVVYDDVFARTGVLYQKLQNRHLDARSAVISLVISVNDVTSQVAAMRCQNAFDDKLARAGKLADELGTEPPWPNVWPAVSRERVPRLGPDGTGLPRAGQQWGGRDETSVFPCPGPSVGLADRTFQGPCVQLLVDPDRFEQLRADGDASRHTFYTVRTYYPGVFNEGLLQNELRAIWGYRDMRLEPQCLLEYIMKRMLTCAPRARNGLPH